MAINSKPTPNNDNSVPNLVERPINPGGSINPWRAVPASMRHGLPGYQTATGLNAATANCSLTNLAADKRPAYLRTTYLWINNIESSWSVQGDTQQAHTSRTFYPKHLVQGDFLVSGVAPNQFEFDKLVEFVQHHQHTAISDMTNFTPQTILNQNQFAPIIFRFFKPMTFGFYHVPENMVFTALIQNIQAGHERFQFAPAYTLTLKIIQHGDVSKQGKVKINKLLTTQRIWGLAPSAALISAQQQGVNSQSQVLPSPNTPASALGTFDGFVLPPTVETSSTTIRETYVTQPGDTLKQIAKRIYGIGFRWKDIFRMNQDILSVRIAEAPLPVGLTLVIPRGADLKATG